MPEIGSSGLMSGDGKRSVGHRPQATAPILDSTSADVRQLAYSKLRSAPMRSLGLSRTQIGAMLS
jgi:hypothetical protein